MLAKISLIAGIIEKMEGESVKSSHSLFNLRDYMIKLEQNSFMKKFSITMKLIRRLTYLHACMHGYLARGRSACNDEESYD